MLKIFIKTMCKTDLKGLKTLRPNICRIIFYTTCILNGYLFFSDDLRTANIIVDDPEGVTCLVIDRDTYLQLISNLDEVRTKYIDDVDDRRR